ncbi:MAG: hypothetical protein J6D27_03550 [Ruminiclostridium sp.]|nr:hypothetical protein [Ruminiclostridium sp.]
MTDNDIIKNLERLSEEDPDGFSSDVLNYINGQKTEIDNLNSELTLLKNDNKHLKGLYEDEKQRLKKAKGKVIDICKRLKTTKSETISEYEERLKEKAVWDDKGDTKIVYEYDIGKIAKEMAGDTDER